MWLLWDTYILVTWDITAAGGDANTRVAFKNCAPFTKCITHINDEHVDSADNLDIIMPWLNTVIIFFLQFIFILKKNIYIYKIKLENTTKILLRI